MGLQFTFLHLKNKLFDYNMILAFKIGDDISFEAQGTRVTGICKLVHVLYYRDIIS